VRSTSARRSSEDNPWVRSDSTRERHGHRVARVLEMQGGALLPLSDYGRDGAPITYKAWVCSNPECGFNIRIDNGEISYGRTIGSSHK